MDDSIKNVVTLINNHAIYKLPKSSIIRTNDEFQAVYRQGKSLANKMAVLYVLPNGSDIRRVGFAAGKRLGSAVVRNRVKRLLREVYRLNQHRLETGFDLVIIGRQAAVGAGYDAVARGLLDLWDKANILRK